MARLIALMTIAFALAGCATIPPSPLAMDELRSMRLAGVEIAFKPDGQLNWPVGEEIVYNAAGRSASGFGLENVTGDPAGRAKVEALARERFRAVLERELAGEFAGTRPVRLDVTVKTLDIPTAGRRVLIGGASTMFADAVLVDVKSGRELAEYRGQGALIQKAGGPVGVLVQAAVDGAFGEPDTYDRLTEIYAKNYRAWLLRR